MNLKIEYQYFIQCQVPVEITRLSMHVHVHFTSFLGTIIFLVL